MSNELADVALRHIKAEIESRKREVEEFYAELKIKLPRYLKTCTCDQVRSAGGIYVATGIQLPAAAVAQLKAQHKDQDRREEVEDKIRELVKLKKNEIIAYYKTVKSMTPENLRNLTLEELEDKDLEGLTIDIVNFRMLGKRK